MKPSAEKPLIKNCINKKPVIRQLLLPWLWKSPYRYWLIGLIRQRKNILTRNYDILIDGYPRSANTFTTFAFKAAQKSKIKVSSHHHNPAAVLAAVSSGKPTLVLVREPKETILSWTVFSGYPIQYNLKTYIYYYSILESSAANFQVGLFNEVTQNLGAVIYKINERFRCNFDLPVKNKSGDPESNQIFQKIELGHIQETGSVDARRIAKPSTEREILKNQLRSKLNEPEIAKLLESAEQLYNKFSKLAAGE